MHGIVRSPAEGFDTSRTTDLNDPADRIREEASRLDAHGGAVIATDAAGTILFWNDAACELYGWSGSEVLGANILSVTPTYTSSEEAAEIMECLRQGRPWSGRFLVKRRDGRPLVAHVTDIPVMERGEVVGILGISHQERRRRSRPQRAD